MGWTGAGARRGPLAAALALACLAAAARQGAAASPAPPLSLVPSTSELSAGDALSLSGSAGAGGPETVRLQSSPYPYAGDGEIAATTSARDGSFSFAGVELDRNTRLRVVLASAPSEASPVVSVIVDPVAVLRSQSLGPGRVRLSMRLVHTAGASSLPAAVSWFLSSSPSALFTLAAVSATREIAPGVSYASTIVDPPSRRFAFRACLNPSWEAAMGGAATHGPCPRTPFRLPHG